jgi:hypothetical protein
MGKPFARRSCFHVGPLCAKLVHVKELLNDVKACAANRRLALRSKN